MSAERSTVRQLLTDRSCRRLVLTRLLSLVGDFLTPVALAFAVLDQLHGGATEVGLAVGPAVAGVALAAMCGGVLADRFAPLKVMAAVDTTRFVLQLTSCVLLVTNRATIPELAVLSFLRGLAGGFFGPASKAAWPQVVHREDLQRINGLLGLIGGVGVVLGPAFAAILLTLTTPGWVIGLDAVTFLLSAWLLHTIAARPEAPPSRVKSRRRVDHGPRPLVEVPSEFARGWREVRSRSWLLLMLVQATVVSLLTAGPLLTLGPTLAHQFYSGVGSYAAFLAAAGVGALLSSVVVMSMGQARSLCPTALCLLLVTPVPIALAVKAPVPLVIAAYFLLGAAEALYGAMWDTELQRRIPRDVIARVASFDMTASFVAMPMGALLAGPVSESRGMVFTLWVSAVAVPAVTVPTAMSRSVRARTVEVGA